MKNLKYYIFLVVTLFAVSLQAQYGISAKVGSYTPVSTFSNNYDNGFGGEFTIIYRTNPSIEFGITSGYSSYSADEEALKERVYEEYKEIIDNINIDGVFIVEAPLNIIPLTLNVKYLFGKKNFKPYFFFEAGVFFYELTTKGSVEITNGPRKDLPETVEKNNSTMLGFGGGIQYKLSKKLFLDFTAKWSIMNNIRLVEEDVNEDLSGTNRTAQTVGLLGGLSYYF